jgi:putative ABC transport system permease protein
MLKNYFKIYIKIALENKLYTFLSLFGISMTIMFVMIFSMAITKITSGSGPEKNLKNIIFCNRVKTVPTHKGVRSTGYSISACGRWLSETHLKKIKSADLVSMYINSGPWEFILNGKYQKMIQNQTDAEYWKIYDYDFLEGRPYTVEEVEKGANLAVISESLRQLLFGPEKNVLGKIVHYTSIDLTITGVVADPPATDQNANGDLFFPYTVLNSTENPSDYLGWFVIAYKGSSSGQLKNVRDEVQQVVSKLDASDTTKAIFVSGPFSQLEKMMVGYGDPEEYSRGSSILKYFLFALAFLLLPAINLMALNFARIHERGEEIAVRKSFGAASGVLRSQFLFENLLMTLAGGVIGMLLSYIVVALFGKSMMIQIDFFNTVPLTFSFNYIVFAAALLACLVFGLLSGFLPAVRLAKMRPAVYLKGGEL